MKIISNLLVFTAALALLSCRAEHLPTLPEEPNRFNLTTTQQLQDPDYCQRIEAFYDGGLEGTFSGKADVPIYYRIFKHTTPDKGAILISTGRTEAALKYKEVIFDLYSGRMAEYPQHELMMEKDEQRIKVLNATMMFFDQY